MVAVQRRGTARVLGLQGARAELQNLYFSAKSMKIRQNLSIFPGWRLGWLALSRYRARPEHLVSQVHERFLEVRRQQGYLTPSNRSGKHPQR